MNCPKCKGDNIRVGQTIRVTGSIKIYRKRKCNICGHAFDTVEEIIEKEIHVIPTTCPAIPTDTESTSSKKPSRRKASTKEEGEEEGKE